MKILSEVDTRGFDEMVREDLKQLKDIGQRRKYIRRMVLRFVQGVVPRTPVDTGRARAGWSAAAGKVAGIRGVANQIEIDGGDHGMQEIGRRESSYKERLGGNAPYAEITNAAPYISYLELGSSAQAPSGFVRLTLREMGGDAKKISKEYVMEALKKANDKARAKIGLRQGVLRDGSSVVGRL
jgi:hypothetical protein